jgi:hypothetical protein
MQKVQVQAKVHAEEDALLDSLPDMVEMNVGIIDAQLRGDPNAIDGDVDQGDDDE